MNVDEQAAALAHTAEQIAAAARAFSDTLDRILADEKTAHDKLMAELKSRQQ